MSRSVAVDEIEELLGQSLVFERSQLERGEQRQRLTMADLERALRCGVFPPTMHMTH